MQPINVLVTVTGRDRPGVTAALFGALAAHDIEVLDVEQVVIRERLILGVLLSLRGDQGPLRRSLGNACGALDLEFELVVTDETTAKRPPNHPRSKLHVILLGQPLRPGAVADIAQRIADVGGNIESVTQLSVYPTSSLDLIVADADEQALREVLARAAAQTGLDIAVEAAGLARRAKRLVVLDVDSTLVQGEGIDELARCAGVLDEVTAITAGAMGGSLDFAESLTARVELLAGLPVADVERVRDALVLTPGARTLVRTLKRLGYTVGVVSGASLLSPPGSSMSSDWISPRPTSSRFGTAGSPDELSATSWTVQARPPRCVASPSSSAYRWLRRWPSATAPTTSTCCARPAWASPSTPRPPCARTPRCRSTSPSWMRCCTSSESRAPTSRSRTASSPTTTSRTARLPTARSLHVERHAALRVCPAQASSRLAEAVG
jgi:predicted amino acid-binding ACT domain protein